MDIWIGYDAQEPEAFAVCRYSLLARTGAAARVQALRLPHPLYRRTWHRDPEGRRVDDGDGRPFATDFAFSRFLVPALMDYAGWALFCDCDFLFQADVADLWAQRDERYAVQCVHHDHRPGEPTKMDGASQRAYPRKNWSSLVLWNCAHPANRTLTPELVNTRPGLWLHTFSWLPDSVIGTLPEEWNWLAGWSPGSMVPKAIHYTGGGPWFAGCRNVPLAERWLVERDRMGAEDAAQKLGGVSSAGIVP